jgi:hypothetical protein
MTQTPFDAPIPIRSAKPNPERSPNITQVNSVVLREGPRARSELVHFAICDNKTGEFKKHSFSFHTKHKDKGDWQKDATKSFTLNSDEEIHTTIKFILAACGDSIPNLTGACLVLPTPKGANTTNLEHALKALSQESKAGLLVEMLDQVSQTPDLLQNFMRQAALNPDMFSGAAATLNLARYQQSLAKLKSLIETSNRENDFQQLLKQHPWMFGSEYSEIINTRVLTRGSQQDFVLRRTTDGYIELVEIKTPLNGQSLFRFDDSHKSHYAGQGLSMVVGQVQKYLEEIDASRNDIFYRDKEDAIKIRAKIIIGRDGNEDQTKAIRRFNGHLHRIEVITFDQLSRVAGQVVKYLESLLPKAQTPESDDIPF